MKTLAITTAILAVLSGSALAQSAANLDHNGSTMRLDIVGSRVTIRYVAPRQGLAVAGVQPGALLFEGTVRGDVVMGNAMAFKQKCAPAPYQVAGRIEGNGFVLMGAGPERKAGCAVSGYSPDSPHSRLAFVVTDPSTAQVLATQADPSRPRTAGEMIAAKPSAPPREAAPVPVPVPAPVPVVVPAPPSLPVTPAPVASPVPTPVEKTPPAAPVPVAPPPAVVAAPATPPSPPSPISSDPATKPAPAKAKPKLDADL